MNGAYTDFYYGYQSLQKPTWFAYTILSLRWNSPSTQRMVWYQKTSGPGIATLTLHACWCCFHLHDVRTILPILILSSIPVRAPVCPRWLRASIFYWLHFFYSWLSLHHPPSKRFSNTRHYICRNLVKTICWKWLRKVPEALTRVKKCTSVNHMFCHSIPCSFRTRRAILCFSSNRSFSGVAFSKSPSSWRTGSHLF